jgi:hypothetical protein
MMVKGADELREVVQDLYENWGGGDLVQMDMSQTFQFALLKYPYDSTMHIFSLHRTYIGQLGSVMIACRARGLFNTAVGDNTAVMWKLKQVRIVYSYHLSYMI